MLVQFSVVPIGVGASLGERLAEILTIVDSSGLPYKVNPMGTVVEGDWKDIMRLIRRCHTTSMKRGERTLTSIVIDDRRGASKRIDEKVRSLEKRLGRTLKK